MDFHHLDPTQKDFSISNALYKLHYTRELILAELEKCIVDKKKDRRNHILWEKHMSLYIHYLKQDRLTN